MLGDLVEFTIRSKAIVPAVDFYRKLGFIEIGLGDTSDEPAVAMSLPGVTIGLTENSPADPVLTFVRPDLKNYLRGVRRQKIELEFAELDDHQFHKAGFRDPNGQLVVLLEARSYSPAVEDAALSIVGDFIEYSLPTRSINESSAFWSSLGVNVVSEGDRPSPWARVSGHGLTLGLYSGTRFDPGLTFRCSELSTRAAFLEAQGCRLNRGAPFGAADSESIVLDAPDGRSIYLFELPAEA